MNYLNYIPILLILSFSAVAIKIGVSIAISDISIILIVIYSLLFLQKFSFSSLAIWVFTFCFYILLANLVNFLLLENYSFSGFITNYLKLLLIFFMTLTIPAFFNSLDKRKLYKAALVIVNFHCIIILFDPFIDYPWNFDAEGITLGAGELNAALSSRARGLFDEPSFFGAFVGLSLSLILQYEQLSKERVFKLFDYILISSALIVSASLTSFGVLVIFLITSLIIRRNEIFKVSSLFSSIGFFVFFIPILLIFFSSSLIYLSGRLTLIEDGSTLGRFYGSSLYSIEIIKEKPLTGIGLGGANQEIFLESNSGSEFSAISTLLNTQNQSEADGEFRVVTYWATLLAAGGLPSLLIFYFLIIGSLLLKTQTRGVAIMILFLGTTRGGVFDATLWLVITIAFAYYLTDLEKIKKLDVKG